MNHTSPFPITFALRDGVLIHINDAANGLACGCVCPACGDRMVAKQGAKTIHHFAHEGGSDCANGLETTLHLAAKAVLSKELHMVLPEITLTVTARDMQGIGHEFSETVIPSQSVVFDEVTEEQRLGGIIADLICKSGGRALLVEIAVTHFIDDIKREKIRELGLACIEIDLSRMASTWNWNTLKNAVVDGLANKVWITNPRVKTLRDELQRRAQQEIDKSDREILEGKRRQIPGWYKAIRVLEEFELCGQSQQERDALNDAGPKEQAWLSAASLMNLDWDAPSHYLDIPVSGESLFLVARKVWQTSLYAVFIAGQVDESTFSPEPGQVNESISLMKAAWWCLRKFPVRPEFDLLHKHIELLTPEQKDALPNLNEPVRAYLMELADRGYLKTSNGSVSFQIQEDTPHWKRRIPRRFVS